MDNDVIARLNDESEIRNLIARLAHLADFAENLDEYMSYYTQDAVWEYTDEAKARASAGREGLRVSGWATLAADRQRLRDAGVQGPGSGNYHVNTTLSVRIIDQNNAEAESYWLLVNGSDEASLRLIGRYFDRFRREDGRWKLFHRQTSPNRMW